MKLFAGFSAAAIISLMIVGTCQLMPANAQQPIEPGTLSDAGDGLTINKPKAFSGYTLIAPMNSTNTYLIDMEGYVVNEWKSGYTPALSARLLENGHLLRPACDRDTGIVGAGAGGRIQEFTWEGEVVWDFAYGTSTLRPHHEICRLPNGNILAVASDIKTPGEAIAAGRNPRTVRKQLIPECILEIKPTGKTTGEIVWQWHTWDHLIQDFDKSKPNFGDVSEHPELVDLNFSTDISDRMMNDRQQLARLRSLGYVGGGTSNPPGTAKQPLPVHPDGQRSSSTAQRSPQGSDPSAAPRKSSGTVGGDSVDKPLGIKPPGNGPADNESRDQGLTGPMDGDWMHVNSISYNDKLDQIMISVHDFSEVWIIDHSTTTSDAASHKGGRRGHGGDLLYRWGNPRVYRSGSNVDQRLFVQHCAHWIEDGHPGAGHMLVFNNGMGRPDGEYSSVEEVVLPVNRKGLYDKDEFVAYAPVNAVWSYSAPDKSDFLSALVSGAQRLPNGNTFICSGLQRLLFEVTPEKEIVWQFKYSNAGFEQGSLADALVPGFLDRLLDVTDEQKKSIRALQSEVDSQLSSLLTSEQVKKLSEPEPIPQDVSDGGSPRRQFRSRRVGDVLPDELIESLDLSEWQMNELRQLQQYVNDEFSKIWQDDQKTILEQMLKAVGGASKLLGKSSTNSIGPSKAGKPRPAVGSSSNGPIRPPGGLGGIFRSFRYGTDYPGLVGKTLTPGRKLVEVNAVVDRRDTTK